LGLPYSPWSEKARWALDARRVAYRYRVYAPLLGEPLLRLKLGRWRGLVTVPVLTTPEGSALADSADIARWADERGEGPTLFPRGEEAAVARYTELGERGLAAGRGLSLVRLLGDAEGLVEMVPRRVRAVLGPGAVTMSALGVRRTLRKYGADAADTAAHARALADVLDALREALSRAPLPAADAPQTLLGRFSFADIAMAQTLAFVEPPQFGLKLGRAARRSFTHDALRERYRDLVRWRDALYEVYRPRT
jgi:glutathione S-transferase